ncbi:GNAT family N-acetyltransferase [Tropicimonas marinistellae]|uniref:GNAT family N-acetyltransferase n=1 Tax=Tropicimonas marinistellae TaxID=1739787 RepID=UPI0008366788|nr:GNAT family N-acetyltransferase [Tropicimonas marinistellae]
MELNQIIGQSVIPSARITLRPLQKSDKGLLELYAGDERIARYTRSIPHPMPPGAVEAFINRSHAKDRKADVWALDGTASGLGELVGVVSLSRMEDAPGKSEIGYWVAPLMWHTGLASEAVGALLAANPQECETIFAEVFQDNPYSARILTHAGFEYLGDAEVFSLARGSNVPTWTYLKKL